jgi:pimeloyl-ACP methyl ester carboxylesterase
MIAQSAATRCRAERDVSEHSGLRAVELTRAAAMAGAAANVWTSHGLAEYRRRLERVRFRGEWLRPFLADSLPSPRHPEPVRALADTGVPVLLLHGRHDLVFPAGLVEPTARELQAQAAVIDAVGHMAHIDQPEQWLAAVAAFLASG